jgi:hypothetical protein
LGDQSEKNEVGGACSTYWRDERCLQGFGGKPKGKRYLEDPGTDGRILRWIIKKWDGGMDWIDVAEDRDRLRALVNAVMNLWVP